MSHITIVINRAPHPPTDGLAAEAAETSGVNYATVSYTPEDSMTEEQVAHAVKKLYKQVRDMGP